MQYYTFTIRFYYYILNKLEDSSRKFRQYDDVKANITKYTLQQLI